MATTMLEAGSDLDRLVAEKVLGWHIYHYDKDHAEHCYYELVDADGITVNQEARYYSAEHKSAESAWLDCPDLSDDIAAAWQVVDRLLTRRIYLLRLTNDSNGYWCQFGRGMLNPSPVQFGETAALAICRAALLAVA